MSLNKRQKLFCDYYIKLQNIDMAIEKVGYKKTTAIRLLEKPEIKQYIEDNIKLQQNLLNTEKNTYKIATTNEIKQYLTKVMRGEDEDKALIKERIKAAELLGKTYAIFSGKAEANDINTIIIAGEDDIEE